MKQRIGEDNCKKFHKEQETKKHAHTSELERKIAVYEDKEKLSILKLEKRIKQNKMFTD